MADGRQVMLRAVNRDLRAMPKPLQAGAMAELARELARQLDDGDLKVAGELRRTMTELRRTVAERARAGSTTTSPVDGPAEKKEVGKRDDLDAIKADRAVRRDELAEHRTRRTGAPVHDGAEPQPAAGGDGGR